MSKIIKNNLQHSTSDLPNISILIPTYNRQNFIHFVVRNLKCQDYPHKKLQVVISDDGTSPLIEDYKSFVDIVYPIKVKYLRYNKRMSIGEKRDDLIKKANHNIVAFMDDDDLYEETYISHSYETLLNNKAGCVGVDKLLLLYHPYTKDDFYFLTCGDNKKLIHECTMMMHKKWYNKTKGFDYTSRAEANGVVTSCKLKTIALTDPFKTLTQICHKNNTIDKSKFKNNKMDNMVLNPEITSFILEVMDAK